MTRLMVNVKILQISTWIKMHNKLRMSGLSYKLHHGQTQLCWAQSCVNFMVIIANCHWFCCRVSHHQRIKWSHPPHLFTSSYNILLLDVADLFVSGRLCARFLYCRCSCIYLYICLWLKRCSSHKVNQVVLGCLELERVKQMHWNAVLYNSKHKATLCTVKCLFQQICILNTLVNICYTEVWCRLYQSWQLAGSSQCVKLKLKVNNNLQFWTCTDNAVKYLLKFFMTKNSNMPVKFSSGWIGEIKGAVPMQSATRFMVFSTFFKLPVWILLVFILTSLRNDSDICRSIAICSLTFHPYVSLLIWSYEISSCTLCTAADVDWLTM